jgi:Erv1 / Alr family
MTKVWGPMGWMTLHSISICYPDEPSDMDKKILMEFMNAFGGSITCFHCRSHFSNMFADYKRKVPSWLNSKRDLFLAICRMHNAVNRRLDKPQPKTVAECIEWLKTATSYTDPRTFRERYSSYLVNDWYKNRHSGDGMSGYRSAELVKKINEQYWNNREVSYSEISFGEDNVITYSDTYKSQKTVLPKFSLGRLLGRP